MTVYRFRATPLTPIHIGDGNSLAPEDYLIEGDHLVQFNRAATLRDMKPETRRQLEERLDRNDFQAAQEILRKSVQARHHRCRIQIGAESKADLLKAVGNPLDPVVRQRAVQGFVRNPLTGQPFLPGSSIKGAIRTAVVSQLLGTAEIARLHEQARPLVRFEERRRTERRERQNKPPLNAQEQERMLAETKIAAHAQLVERIALGYGGYNTERRKVTERLERDPFRLIRVSDADIGAEATRVDQVWLHLPGNAEGSAGIQMHYERLLSRADTPGIHAFPVTVEIDDVAARHPEVRKLLGQALDFDRLRQACNTFYWRRMNIELDRFFPAREEAWKNTYNKVKIGLAVRNAESKLILTPPPWPNRLLLRVGRFSHFESLSVDDFRQGWNIQKRKYITEGSTRTLCRARFGNDGQSTPVPFGWLLLELEGQS